MRLVWCQRHENYINRQTMYMYLYDILMRSGPICSICSVHIMKQYNQAEPYLQRQMAEKCMYVCIHMFI